MYRIAETFEGENFADFCPFAKVFFVNIACARNQYPVYSMNPRKFLCEIFMFVVSRKLSPSKLSRYTVSLESFPLYGTHMWCVVVVVVVVGRGMHILDHGP